MPTLIFYVFVIELSECFRQNKLADEVGHRYSNTSAISRLDKNADEIGHRSSNTSATRPGKMVDRVCHRSPNTSGRLEKDNDEAAHLYTSSKGISLQL